MKLLLTLTFTIISYNLCMAFDDDLDIKKLPNPYNLEDVLDPYLNRSKANDYRGEVVACDLRKRNHTTSRNEFPRGV